MKVANDKCHVVRMMAVHVRIQFGVYGEKSGHTETYFDAR